MRLRPFVLSVALIAGLLVVGAALMMTTIHPAKADPAPTTVAPADLTGDDGGYSSAEPVVSCAGGCPSNTICTKAGQHCTCPHQHGKCVACDTGWKCVAQ